MHYSMYCQCTQLLCNSYLLRCLLTDDVPNVIWPVIGSGFFKEGPNLKPKIRYV